MLEGGIKYRIGTWDSDTKDNSSNYRDFKNVVDALGKKLKPATFAIPSFFFAPTTLLLSGAPLSKATPQAKIV
jgi:hypothetical protein